MKVTYPSLGVVSVWVGTFQTEKDFDQSMEADVTNRLKLETPIESICEVSFEPDKIGIRTLLEGFSGWETFFESATNAALQQGIETANAALVCYYLKCDGSPSKWGQLNFLG